MSFCGEAVDVFCVSMVNLPRCTQDNNESSLRPAEWCGRVLNGVSYCGTWRSYTTWRLPWECFLPPPSSRGFWDRQRLGLLAKGMTHGMTKLLCLSVRLGLYPTDICWLRLIQAPEKPGIRVRHRWLFFFLCNSVSHKIQNEGKEKKLFSNPHPVFTDSLKYNCLYKNIRNQRVFSYCSGVLVFFWYFLLRCLFFFSVLTQPHWWLSLDWGPLLVQRHFSSSE